MSRVPAQHPTPKTQHPVLVVGLTGGIASGKTTVSRMFGELGAVVIDADQHGREVVEPGEPALAEIVRAFGTGYLLPDGTLNRRALGDRVFGHPADLSCLNRITHPRISEQLCKKITHVANGPVADPVVVVEAAVLIEAGWAPLVDKIIVVVTQPSVQAARLMAGSRMDASQAEARIEAQIPLRKRLKYADYRVHGDVPLSQTRAEVSAVWEELLRLAARLQADGR
jgi:dephospho-CoA kinase